MKTVAFLGFDKTLGLTFHFVDWILALERTAANNVKLIFVTLKKEQNEGLHDKLKANLSIDVAVLDRAEDLESLECLGKVDVVHCHGFTHVAMMLKIRRRKKAQFRIVVTMHHFRHGVWYRPLYTNLVSLFCNRIDAMHFLSHVSKDEFLRWNLLYNRSNRSFVFPLGCNGTEFAKDQSVEDLDFFRELTQSEKNIVYLAEFSRRKQHVWLLKTIGDTLIKENACLWLFGGMASETKRVVRYINDNGLSQHVKIPGRVHREYIPSILKRMDCAVCSSKSENSPHSIMEPMFAGIPVVTLNVGTASYLIRDYANGFVVRNRSEGENFRKAVEYLLGNADVASKMGTNNKEIANQWLTWESTCDNSVNMYLSIS